MSTPLTDRLREASLLLEAERIDDLSGALERLGSARLTVEDTLTRVRLAHLLDPGSEGVERFLALVNKDSELVAGADRQLLAVLAATSLIDAFGREPSRSAAVMRRVVIAALAVRTLAYSASSPAHPDLRSWADHLLVSHGRRVRRTKHSQPPRLAEGAEGEEPGREARIDESLERLETYANETGNWLELSAGAGSIAALHEQNQTLWWLITRPPEGERSEEAIIAARQLAAMSLTPPPPSSAELLRRRLILLGEEPIEAEEFERHRSSDSALAAAALPAPDLTPILASGIRGKLSTAQLSHAVYEELTLAVLIEDERAALTRARRQAEEQSRSAEQQAAEQAEEQPQ
jgi:hypothetical protein